MRAVTRTALALLATTLAAGCGGGGGGSGPQAEVSTWTTSGDPVDGTLVGCTDPDLEGIALTSFASTCLAAPGFRVEQTGGDLTVPPQVIACPGGDVSVSGTGTKSSSGQVEIVLRFEVLPPLGPNLRWESFAGIARRDTFPLAWQTVDVSNETFDGACLISPRTGPPPVPVTFTVTP